jgi:RNase P subunit RPR2
MRKFVRVTKNFHKNGFTVRENEIGIVEKEGKGTTLVFFFVSNSYLKLRKADFEYIDIKKTGDAYSQKICNVCHRLLDVNKFAKNQNAKNNRPVRRPSCRECRKKIDGVNISTGEKKKWVKQKPEYEPFTCPICQKTTIPGVTSRIVLDHNHNTGKIRGWICDSCNTGLGRFKDDISLLERAILYLQREED